MDPWLIVDPRFADPHERSVAETVLAMVTSHWQHVPEIDIADPVVSAVLRRHRIATLVPTEAVPAESQGRFREELQTAYVTQMRLQAAALEICRALTDAGIEHRVLKGLASAFLDYPRPELRQTGDVDLVVRPEALVAVERLLADRDAVRLPGSRAGELMKGTTWNTPRGVEIDVHTRLFIRSWGEASPLDVPGEPLESLASAALPLELRLVHAAGHMLGSPVGARRMSGMIDTVRLLAADPDPGRVRNHARDLGVEGLVGASIGFVQTLSSQRRWPQLVEWEELDWFDRRVLLANRRRWGLEYLGRMRNVAPGRRLAYLPTWLVPRREAARKAWVDIRSRRNAS